MTVKSRPWLHFDVQIDQVEGNWMVRHFVQVTTTPDPGSKPVSCEDIQLVSQLNGARRTTRATNSASVTQILSAADRHYRRSALQITVKQNADAVPEYVRLDHVAGLIPEGAYPLEALPTELDALRYVASYNDLCQDIGPNAEAARAHFRRYGDFENREVSFDPLIYVASYGDLIEYKDDPLSATRHYIIHGWREGRKPAAFEPFLYLASNIEAGLVAKLGLDPIAATRHYIDSGRTDGLPTDSFDLETYRKSNIATDGLSDREALRHFLAQHN